MNIVMKSFTVLALMFFLVTGSLVGAGQYKSNFGFTANIDDKWVVQTVEMLENRENVTSSTELRGLGEHLAENILKFVKEKRFELVYRNSGDEKYSDNIYTFLLSPNKLNLKRTGKECIDFNTHIERQYKRDVFNKVYSCGYKASETLPMIKIVYDGYVIGTKSTTYRFITPKGTVQIVATCKKERCEETFKEIEEMLKSIK